MATMKIAAVLRPQFGDEKLIHIDGDGELTANQFPLGGLSEVDARWLLLLVVSWADLGDDVFQRVGDALGGLPIGDPKAFVTASVIAELTQRRFFLRLMRGAGAANRTLALERELEARGYIAELVAARFRESDTAGSLKELSGVISALSSSTWHVFSEYLADDH